MSSILFFPHQVRPLELDHQRLALAKSAGVPGHDAMAFVAFGFAAIQYFARRRQRVTGIDRLVKVQILDPEEHASGLAQVLYTESEYRVEHQHRTDHDVGMAFRARELRIEIARVVMQRQRREDRIVGLRNRTSPVMDELAAGLEF